MSQREGRKHRVFVIDDHPIVRHGLCQCINREDDLVVCGDAADGESAITGMATAKADVVLVDISLPSMNGIELIKAFKLQYGIPILVVSMHDEQIYAERALRAGALGYVPKQEAPEVIVQAIRRVLQGKIWVSDHMSSTMLHTFVDGKSAPDASPVQRLTDRELQVFELIGRGLGTREISDALNISRKTVESHREHIKEKMNLKNGLELVQTATRHTDQLR